MKFLTSRSFFCYRYWKEVHDKFFCEEYKSVGKKFYEQAPMLCEVFEKIYYIHFISEGTFTFIYKYKLLTTNLLYSTIQ